ncbi:hypothetical protein TrVGV298_001816 [Trichoderma virens]|nr:hypothetical protein TrVGV298_001816 [Trichoderma virens]
MYHVSCRLEAEGTFRFAQPPPPEVLQRYSSQTHSTPLLCIKGDIPHLLPNPREGGRTRTPSLAIPLRSDCEVLAANYTGLPA